jgi:hypothetical protein
LQAAGKKSNLPFRFKGLLCSWTGKSFSGQGLSGRQFTGCYFPGEMYVSQVDKFLIEP